MYLVKYILKSYSQRLKYVLKYLLTKYILRIFEFLLDCFTEIFAIFQEYT